MSSFVSKSRPLKAWPLIVAALLGMGVALQAPLATTIIGLMIFGVFHNLYELRYVASRFVVNRVPQRPAWLVGSCLLLVIFLKTCSGFGWLDRSVSRVLEIALIFGSMLLAVQFSQRSGWLRNTAVLCVICGALVSIWKPIFYFLALSHLHNVMPVLFLLLHPKVNKRALIGSTILWAFVIPLLILSGALDSILAFENAFYVENPIYNESFSLTSDASWAFLVNETEAFRLKYGWARYWLDDPRLTIRIVATFSFLQWMHYFIWVLYLPRFGGFAPPTEGGFIGKFLFGKWGFISALLATVLFWPWYSTNYIQAFIVYGTLASFHALVEFPILLWFLLTPQEEPLASQKNAS